VTVPHAQATNVHFRIDRLSLAGFSPTQRARFVSALESSLTALAGTAGMDWAQVGGRRLAHIDAGELSPGASPEDAAQRVAARLGALVAERGEGRERR
jgi:hypothetical protein